MKKRGAKRFYDTKAWREIADAFRRSRPDICAVCGARGARQVDHVKPRRAGGDDSFSNMQLLCHPCHSRKTARRDGAFGNRRAADASYGPHGCAPDGSPLDPTHWWNRNG